MPDKVPLWIIRNTFCPYGSRMPGRPETMPPDLKICKTCNKEMYSFRDWNWCDGEYYCNDHVEAARKINREQWQKKYGVPGTANTTFRPWQDDVDDSDRCGFEYMEFGVRSIPRTEAAIPAGNLDETEYAFWIGNTHRYSGTGISLRATCRACNQTVFGKTAREGHKATSCTFYKDKISCPKVLMLSYQQLLKQDECLVCKSKCFGKQRWGVPLCCPNCIKTWKFDETIQYESLERTMMQYWVTLEIKNETGGLSTSASS